MPIEIKIKSHIHDGRSKFTIRNDDWDQSFIRGMYRFCGLVAVDDGHWIDDVLEVFYNGQRPCWGITFSRGIFGGYSWLPHWIEYIKDVETGRTIQFDDEGEVFASVGIGLPKPKKKPKSKPKPEIELF